MSITLDTVASERRDGRCVDCGRYLSRNDVHFHGPKRKFTGPPRAHLYRDGGGMVTRCDDPGEARMRLMRKYATQVIGKRLSDLDEEELGDVERVFPLNGGTVERGRINVCDPDADYSWVWMALPDDAKGPGVTTAVVWAA